MLVGVIAGDPEHVQLFGFTALFPVTFVSSAFVPVDTMPTWLQGFVQANPVSLLTDAARALSGEIFMRLAHHHQIPRARQSLSRSIPSARPASMRCSSSSYSALASASLLPKW